MVYLFAFLFLGTICLLGQLLYQFTKLTIGHIVCLLVVAGAIAEAFGVYPLCHQHFGAGAALPICSFGALLTRGALEGAQVGALEILSSVFQYVSVGIGFAVFAAASLSLFFKPKL